MSKATTSRSATRTSGVYSICTSRRGSVAASRATANLLALPCNKPVSAPSVRVCLEQALGHLVVRQLHHRPELTRSRGLPKAFSAATRKAPRSPGSAWERQCKINASRISRLAASASAFHTFRACPWSRPAEMIISSMSLYARNTFSVA